VPIGTTVGCWLHDGAGQGARDALDRLDPCHDELPEVIDGLGLSPDDHVVGPGHVLGLGDAGHGTNRCGDRRCLADFCLDQDVRVHHVTFLLALQGPPCYGPHARPCNAADAVMQAPALGRCSS
jgi:hypothetical protein